MDVAMRRAILTRWGPFFIPPLYLAFILWLQPADHFGSAPDKAPWLNRAVYDDWDLTALALRGLNASLGRASGRADNPEQISDDEYARSLDEPRPLQPRYYLEYPHATLPLFRLPYWIEPLQDAPAALCDGAYGNIVEHRPRNDPEMALWGHLRQVEQVYLVTFCLCTLLLLAVLRIGYETGSASSGPLVLLVLPATLYFSLNRFDIVPALLTAAGLACLGRRRCLASGVLFGVATAIKIYPAFLAPLVLHYLWLTRRDAGKWLAGYFAALAACFLPPLVYEGWQVVWQPFQFQLTRPPMGLTAYGYLLPESLQENDAAGRLFRLGSVALVVLLLSWRRPPDLTSVLRRAAIAVLVFIAVPVFYSPQWLVWLTPLLVPLAGRRRSLLWLIVALDAVTYVTFPLGGLELPAAMLVYARYAVLAGMIGVLGCAEMRPMCLLSPPRAKCA
jgi:hypothetical protein